MKIELTTIWTPFRAEQELKVLRQVAQTVNASLNLQEVLRLALEALREAFGFEQPGIRRALRSKALT